MDGLIKVGMADYKSGRSPERLISYGLGSCVGIALFDPESKIGGLAHIMLPESSKARANENPFKFADTAVPLMIDDLVKKGALRSRLVAKIAGGAQMFTFTNATDIMRVGERNSEAVRSALKTAKIRILAADTGGKSGRTLEFCIDSGILRVRTINSGEKEL